MKKNLLTLVLFLCFFFKNTAQTPPQYTEQILSLTIPVGKLEGTLVMPKGVRKPNLVFIIAGSGPTDRDCNSAGGLNTNAFKMLADSLARLGVASFRYDKRGVGASKVVQRQFDVVFEDFVNDAVLWLDTLKSLKKFKKIIVVGHSEGSLIGTLVAQKTKSADRLVSICGVPLAIDSMLYIQLGKQSPVAVAQLRTIYNAWKQGDSVDSVPRYLFSVARPALRNFMSSCMKYDPAVELKNLKKPVFFIGGKNDVQVMPNLFENLAKARPEAQLLMFPKMTHVLKDGTTNMNETVALYNKPEVPITEGVAEAIAAFAKGK